MQKILVVDDDQENLDYMNRHLTNFFNCDVECFLNPTEALVWSKENDFDLGIFDNHMSDLSGLELVRKVRRHHRHHDTPLILIFSEESRAIITDAFDAGVSDYLFRPFERAEFISRIQNILSLRDITQQLEKDKQTLEQCVAQATQDFQESEQRFRLALEATKDGIWDWNLETGEIFYSAHWCQMLGYAKEDVPTFPAFWMGRVHPDDAYVLTTAIDSHIMGKNRIIDCEYRLKHRKGYDVWVHTQGKAVRNEKGTAVRIVGAQSDISDFKEVQSQLAHSALHDALTGLPNRALFDERLKQSFLRFKRNEDAFFTILFLDLDEFKEINDSYGHALGDQVLMAFTKILKKCTREVDTIARFGGDEFVIFLEKISTKREVQIYINRLYKEAHKALPLADSNIKLHFSIGVATVNAEHESHSDIMKEADIALYQAKEQGRNQAVFYVDELREISPRRREMVASLGDALGNNEIEIYYQPIVCLKTQEHLGYEALLRWHHPTMGTISPEDFIPIAEKNDMIVRLGTFVMQGAIEQLALWQKKYDRPKMFMCINVTSAQVFRPDYLDILRKACKEESVMPGQVVLEFSELGFSEIYKWDSSILKEMKQVGFHIALDDYGESRASIRSLVDYQMDFLKIDRSLSLELLNDERKRRLFDLMIYLGAEGGLQIVVEGIQSQEILDYVVTSKAQMGQGYLFSKPCPVDKIEAMYKRKKRA